MRGETRHGLLHLADLRLEPGNLVLRDLVGPADLPFAVLNEILGFHPAAVITGPFGMGFPAHFTGFGLGSGFLAFLVIAFGITTVSGALFVLIKIVLIQIV